MAGWLGGGGLLLVQAERERKAKEAQEKKEQEEFDQWKDMFTVEKEVSGGGGHCGTTGAAGEGVTRAAAVH